MAFRFVQGISLTQAAENLRSCALMATNLRGGGASGLSALRNDYLMWVTNTEAQLSNVFADPSVIDHLRGERYWRIRELGPDSPRPTELINEEAARQQVWLEGLVAGIKALEARLARAPGLLTVLDTNVLLHWLPPREINWREVMGVEEVRLVVPLRVVEELDGKKYLAREQIADRARGVLRDLRKLLAPDPAGSVPLNDGATIEVPVDEGPRRRTLDADEEVLATCLDLRAVSQRCVLVTGDTGITLRALAVGLEVTEMPEKYRRRRDQP
jgi:rRNA-processing protein FCF1